MSSKYLLRALLPLFIFAVGLQPATADLTFDMEVVSDDDSRWYEFYRDVFADVGQGFDGDPAMDGFFLISAEPDPFNPVNYREWDAGTPVDVFPNELNFSDSYSLTYDDSNLSFSGLETADVTSLLLNFNVDIADNDDQLGLGYTTATSNVTGTVTLFNGEVAAINVTSDIQMLYDTTSQGGGVLAYDGSFTITEDSWELYVDDTESWNFLGPSRYVWDAQGYVANLSAVPEPSTMGGVICAGGVAFLVWLRKRKKRC